ncbi:SusC/RagA family TonB-linked outer membrane protein [Flavobacterium oreochromis]|uniref:TonB-dependent receptor plug domain-containing protein n=1 Tax=Flavobacterium columnare TaxID=996 RepID=A0A2D0AI05_9FLAO|nr:SusC/RagA family TonB-linked outer membrane protein [Flavobacterium oreochromis]OWP79455.1 hypothetical protein BWK62_01810 [Flavobacterium oreochromis]
MRSKFKWIFTLLLALTMQFSFAQEKTITGVVTDANGPLPGVNVVVKGTQRGVSSGFDGKYSIKAKEGETLVFSFMGMREVAKVVGASNVMNTVMQSDAKQIGEVVVTSFGVKRDKKTLGFSTPKINSEELTAAKSTNITNQIGGKIAGLRVSGSGGSFTGSSVIIRGFTTFTGSNQPLYVVDGVPIDNSGGNNQLQQGASSSNRAIDINPEDVENLVVLKDAASTAIYGARGASGVILITTKKGKKGAGTVSFTSSLTVGTVNRLPEYQNEYAQGSQGQLTQADIGSVNNSPDSSWFAGSWGPRINGQVITNSFGQKEVLQAYPDNIKEIFKPSLNVQNNLSFSGATDKSSYRIAIGNTDETYVLDNNRMKRTTLTFSGNSQVTDKLNVGLSFTYTSNNSVRTLQGNQLSNPLFRAYFIPRTYNLSGLPFEDSLGNQLYAGSEDHPLWSIKHNVYNDKVDRVFGNFNMKYDFTSWLNAEFKIGSDFYNFKSNGFDEVGNRGGGFTGAGGSKVGGLINSATNVHNVNSYLTLNAVRKIDNFTFSTTLGNETVYNTTFDSEVVGLGLVVPGFNQIKNTNTYFPATATTRSKVFGLFGDLTVEYKKFLSLNVKARNDWSSTLSKENNSIFYPGVSGSFVLTEAIPSLKLNDKINLIKFRASLGEVGKSPSSYRTNTYYDKANASDGFGPEIKFPYDGLSGYTLSDVAGNPNLTPEFTREVAYGAELGFFNNRLSIDGTIYNRTTRNVILPVPVSATSGVTRVYQNAGRLSTKGVEVMVSGTPVKTENFRWDLGVNYTQFKSVVEELAPGVDNIFLGGFSTPNIRLVAGDEYGQIYGTAYQRDANGNFLIQPTTKPDGSPNPNAGLLLATPNVQKLGNPNPKFTMGVTNTFTYKNLSLYALVDIKKGGDQYSRNIADVQRNGVAIETTEYPRFLEDGVTLNKPYLYQGVYASGPDAGKPNTTWITAQGYYGNNGKYVASEGFIYDTSWYRLRELALTYKFGKNVLNNTAFKQIELGVFGRNLFLKAPNYPHFDPEQNALGVSNAQGLEFNSLPNTRTIGGNLKIVF